MAEPEQLFRSIGPTFLRTLLGGSWRTESLQFSLQCATVPSINRNNVLVTATPVHDTFHALGLQIHDHTNHPFLLIEVAFPQATEAENNDRHSNAGKVTVAVSKYHVSG